MKILLFVIFFLATTPFLFGQDIDALSFKKGLKLNGGLNLSNQFYTGSNPANRRPPYAFFLTGNMNLNLFGFPMPFSFAYSNSGKNYTQPFNNFQLSPKYKWAQANIGTVSTSFSEYTLAGHIFEGASVELTPDNWNIAVAFGRFLRAVPYDEAAANFDQVCYKRMGGGIKVGYNSESFSIETNFFAASDDETSLAMVPQEITLLPQDNYAMGIKVRKTFFKYLLIDLEYDFSVLSGKQEENLEATKNFLQKALPGGSNQRSFDAIAANIGYQAPIWGLQFGYKRVAPGYTTFGGYYFVEDLESFTLQPSLRLWDNRLQLAASAGVEYNNLNGTRSSDDLRIVASPTVSVMITEKWTANASYSNFTSYTTSRPLEDPNFSDVLDTLNFYQVNQNISLATAYSFGSEDKSQQLSGNFSYQFANNRSSADTVAAQLSNFINVGGNYALSINSLGMGVSVGINFNQNNAAGIKSTYIGPTLSVSKSWFDKQVSTGLSNSYSQNFMPQQAAVPVLNTSLNIGYSPKTKSKSLKHRIQTTVGLLNRLKGDEIQAAFYELTAMVSYSFNF